MKSDAEFVFELAATYAERHNPVFRASLLRRFPAQASELRELFNLTDRLERFFQAARVGPDPAFRAQLKAELLAKHEPSVTAPIDSDTARAPRGFGWEWELPRPDRRWTAVGIGSAVAVAGVLAAYWRNRDVSPPPAA